MTSQSPRRNYVIHFETRYNFHKLTGESMTTTSTRTRGGKEGGSGRKRFHFLQYNEREGASENEEEEGSIHEVWNSTMQVLRVFSLGGGEWGKEEEV